MTNVTRRNMLGVAAGTLASAVGAPGHGNLVATAAAEEAIDETELALFVKVSAELTGIAEAKLAPPVDPIMIKREYYAQARKDPAFKALMQIVHADPTNPQAAAEKIMGNADPRIKYLGRSIILAWYLGAWHPPAELEGNPSSPVPNVVSGKAYTQAWTWRVAQAHPMGYSELRFGYWSDEPLPLNDFVKG